MSVPKVNFNLAVTGNDCRCCGGEKTPKPSERVVVKKGSFVAKGTFLSGAEKIAAEDQRTVEYMRAIVQQMKQERKLDPAKVPKLPEGTHVKVRDIRALDAWVRGVRSSPLPRLNSSDLRASEKTGSEDRLGSSENEIPDTPLRTALRGHEGKKASARVVWNEEAKCWNVYPEKEGVFEGLKEKTRLENRRARTKIEEEVTATARKMGLRAGDILSLDGKKEAPLTYHDLQVVDAWLRGVEASFASKSTDSLDQSDRGREEQKPRSRFHDPYS